MKNILTFIVVFACSFIDLRARAQSDDLSKVEGVYLQLLSDQPLSDELKAHVDQFDKAVPLWLAYFEQPLSAVEGWRMTGYLMKDKVAFQQRGLIPGSLPNFPNGYSVGNKLWVMNQPSPYYTTHLLLHEGVHGLTAHLFGGSGPPWYMEGIAEFLATHESSSDDFQIGVIPRSRDESPYWGRIGLIAQRRQEKKVPTIESVMRYSETAHREVEPYAWSWAAAVLMEMYPEYRTAFRDAAQSGSDASPQFTRQFYQSFKDQWPILAARWALLSHDIDYGFDRERNQVALKMDLPLLTSNWSRVDLEANHGWQSAPAKVRKGQQIEVKASGQYQLTEDPKWKATAEGVTLTYVRGVPLGRLIACFVSETPSEQRYQITSERFSVGEGTQLTSPVDGWLLFKVNDHPNDLHNNQGRLIVELRGN